MSAEQERTREKVVSMKTKFDILKRLRLGCWPINCILSSKIIEN